MYKNCKKCENVHICLAISLQPLVRANVIELYPPVRIGKDYCSKIEGSKWSEILKLRESGLKDSEIIEKISNEKLAEMIQYVKANGIELPESIKEQCHKAGFEV